ncbi:hypothetical protein ACFLWL_03715, partial [Chloroflexota bacterium]
FEEAISRTEATGKLTKEMAEASIKTFEEAVGQVEAIGKLAGETEETRESKAKEGKEATDTKGRIESRLEFLARMYDAKKTRQDEEESTSETDVGDEQPK